MPGFTTPLDIADRAIQHIGGRRLQRSSITTLAEWASATDLGASETYFAYDKVRQAELRRNVWKFSKRRCALRTVSSTTHLLTFGTWGNATAYTAGDVVADTNGNPWIALRASTGVSPSAIAFPSWEEYCGPRTIDAYNSALTYYVGELVTSSSVQYISIVNGNVGNSPSSSPSQWLPLTTQGTATTLYVPTPVPYTQSAGSGYGLFYLPARFLRLAAQDPKIAGVSNQAMTAGQQWSDFDIEDQFLITSVASPLVLRFAADIELLPYMDPLFCEGLAARLGKEIAIRLEPSKEGSCMEAYSLSINEARMINAIELGNTDPPDFQQASDQSRARSQAQ